MVWSYHQILSAQGLILGTEIKKGGLSRPRGKSPGEKIKNKMAS